MTPQELRIGNYVLHNYSSRPFEVVEINRLVIEMENSKGRAVPFVASTVKPIPITPEWLKRFGFESRDEDVIVRYHIGHNEVTHDWLFDLKWPKAEHGELSHAPFYKNGRHVIQYIHQLQNLYFALTGEELKLNKEKK